MKTPLFSDAIVFQSDLVRIGAFRCDGEYPGFRDTGPANNDCFVFPRTAVRIEHEHEPPFAANPNVVTFYNRAQQYVRHQVSERGDRCDWFGLERNVAREVVASVENDVREAPFRRTRGWCDSRTYLLQRRLFNAVVGGMITNSIAVEETVILLLQRVLGGVDDSAPSAKTRSMVHEVECLLGSRFDQPLTLAEIAGYVGTSVYHLCRTFRNSTGFTLHEYIRQLRIRHGLEPVCESRHTLSHIAVDLGFAHHSHFTSAFRRDFGVTPSELRSASSSRHC